MKYTLWKKKTYSLKHLTTPSLQVQFFASALQPSCHQVPWPWVTPSEYLQAFAMKECYTIQEIFYHMVGEIVFCFNILLIRFICHKQDQNVKKISSEISKAQFNLMSQIASYVQELSFLILLDTCCRSSCSFSEPTVSKQWMYRYWCPSGRRPLGTHRDKQIGLGLFHLQEERPCTHEGLSSIKKN